MNSPSQQDQRATSEIFRPLRVGSRTAPNRIVFGAHLTNFGRGQIFGDRHLAYYAARAAGGAGMIVTEALTVHPQDYPYEHVPFGHREEIVPSLVRLAAAVRGAAREAGGGQGPLLLAQLNHTGGQCSGRLLRQSPWAPSALPDVASRRIARAMLEGEIEEVIAGFAAAAGHALLAGLDGVEVGAGQHALLRQFLSPLTNQRDDQWGGTLENRARALERVLAAVRGALGSEPVLGVKLCGDELAPWGGLTVEDAAEVALRLAAQQADGRQVLDYISVQIAGPYAAHLTDPGMPTPQGYGIPAAAHLRAALHGAGHGALPVFAEGRIENLASAANALAAGEGAANNSAADAIVMTRALISDPDLPRKWRGDSAEPVRPHIGMVRYFAVRGDWNRPLGDLINPRAGREALLPPLGPMAGAPPALVIGGGPAGLEAACTLARQGRRVRLLEAAPQLGGMARLLGKHVPARAEFQNLVAYYETMVARLGVEVELNRRVAGAEPWMGEYEKIFLAVGGQAPPTATKPRAASAEALPDAPPDAPPRFSARGLLEGMAEDSGPARPLQLPGPEQGCAVVVDSEYGFRMAAAVEWLLEAGYEVQVVSEDFYIGRGLVESGDLPWFNRVAERGVVFHPRTLPRDGGGAAAGAFACADRFAGDGREGGLVLRPVALVVHAAPDLPAEGLYEALRDDPVFGPKLVRIGDARAPRLMGEAILNAHRAVLLE